MSDGKRVPGSARDGKRGDRLAAALRANLKRRKTQARGQTSAEPRGEKHKEPEKPHNPGEKRR